MCILLVICAPVFVLETDCELNLVSSDPYRDSIKWVRNKVGQLTRAPTPERFTRIPLTHIFRFNPQQKFLMSTEIIRSEYKRRFFLEKIQIIKALSEKTQKKYADACYMNKEYGRQIMLLEQGDSPLTKEVFERLAGIERSRLYTRVAFLFLDADSVGGYYYDANVYALILARGDIRKPFFPVLELIRPKQFQPSIARNESITNTRFSNFSTSRTTHPKVRLYEFIKRSERAYNANPANRNSVNKNSANKLPEDFLNIFLGMKTSNLNLAETASSMQDFVNRFSSRSSRTH